VCRNEIDGIEDIIDFIISSKEWKIETSKTRSNFEKINFFYFKIQNKKHTSSSLFEQFYRRHED